MEYIYLKHNSIRLIKDSKLSFGDAANSNFYVSFFDTRLYTKNVIYELTLEIFVAALLSVRVTIRNLSVISAQTTIHLETRKMPTH